MRTYFNIMLSFVFLLLISGCTKLKEDLPVAQDGKTQVHPAGWLDKTSPNFHLKALASSGWDFRACQKCHGSQYTGGIAEVSCMECHDAAEFANLGTTAGKAHPAGWTNTASASFHGKWIGLTGWDMSACRKCHGPGYAGGLINVSCLNCHDKPNGPENCTTCHGGVNAAPPKDLTGSYAASSPGVGAHQQHLAGGDFSAAVACSECHAVPSTVSSPGHIDPTHPGAQVVFNGPIANTVTNEPATEYYGSTLPLITPAPAFHSATLGCENVYCHGDFKNGNRTNTPTWNDTTGTKAACGTCHGDPAQTDPGLRALPKTTTLGGTHSTDTRCYRCHPFVIDRDYQIIDKTKHINGKLNVFGEEVDFKTAALKFPEKQD